MPTDAVHVLVVRLLRGRHQVEARGVRVGGRRVLREDADRIVTARGRDQAGQRTPRDGTRGKGRRNTGGGPAGGVGERRGGGGVTEVVCASIWYGYSDGSNASLCT